MCEHMFTFLLVLRPYGKREAGTCPRVMPADALQVVLPMTNPHTSTSM